MKAPHILGMNARNHLYLARYNTRRGRRIADSKLRTKRFLRRHHFPHPRLVAAFTDRDALGNFDWSALGDNFVVKPASGYAGEGILIVRRRLEADRFQLMDGSVLGLDDLRLHVSDILEGTFDRYNAPDTAVIEERVVKHPRFKRYSYRGTPDIRILLFNNVPVLAMLRLPTVESHGKANLHLGAIGVGVDLATGITTHAVVWDRPIRVVPGTKLKLNGLTVPNWDQMLTIACQIQELVGLGFMAVDFLLDPIKGPVVVELTARPGLSIQLANQVGLKRRLERIEGLVVHKGKGIEVAKALFAEHFSDRVLAEKGVKVVSVFETVKVRGGDGKRQEIQAKLDTGAFRTSIDRGLASELGLFRPQDILWHNYYYSSLGRERREVIPVTFWLSGRRVETTANVSDRRKVREKLLIGRRDLNLFLVRPSA